MRRAQHMTVMTALVAAVVVLSIARGGAHKPITSPYTYNDDVFPLLRDRCGNCHVSGGVAPMSLMTHAETVPWGESIRTELLAGQMPPWTVDAAPGRFRNVQGLSPRELNIILTWVTGGTPIGSQDKDPTPITRDNSWRLGQPDLELPLPSEVVVTADARERTTEFVIPAGNTERRLVRAVDLKPGTPAMVRAATIAVRIPKGSATDGTERVLGIWLPGDAPVALDEGFAFELPPSAELVVRVLYRKTWEYERKEMRDRSTVGLYFTTRSAPIVRALSLTPNGPSQAPGRRSFSRTLDADALALAIYPEGGLANTGVRVTAVKPDGSRAELIAFHPRPDWTRRYWFRDPIPLPRGTRIDVEASFDDEAPLLPLSVAPTTATRTDLSALRLTLNVVSGR